MARSLFGATACVWILGLAGPAAAQVVAYDSGGFEPPVFAPGDLTGQDPAFGPWQRFGGPASTATVRTYGTAGVTPPANGGTSGVQISRAANDVARWAVAASVPVPRTVSVQWDMRVAHAANQGQLFGPFFGADALGSGGRIGLFGLDALTGDVLYLDPINGLQPTTPRTLVPFDEFHNYRMEFSYNGSGGGTYKVFLDGVPLPISNPLTLSSGFVNASGDFTQGRINGLPAAADSASQAAIGSAYFDNFSVTFSPVPEPASWAMAGVAAAAGWRWRRSCRAARAPTA